MVSQTTIIATFDAYPTSTRAKKAARTYAEIGHDVRFIGMSRAGRTGRWADPGRYEDDGIHINLVRMRTPSTEPSRRSILRNAVFTYIPALARMASDVLRTPAQTVHVISAPLAPIGLLHKLRWRSRFILDVQERPGAVAARGSATGLFSKIERTLLSRICRWVDIATVVTHPDVQHMSNIGFRKVKLVRNCPLTTWRAPYTESPPAPPLRLVTIGSIFEGRGYELLIQAAAEARKHAAFTIDVYGPARATYLSQLKELAAKHGVEHIVRFQGALSAQLVSETYLSAHIGLVLYESNDPGNDGLSNKILECVSSGRPVLAGDLPQNHAFVTKNQVGWLSDVTADDLAQSIIRISDSNMDFEAISKRCRELGDTELNWEREFRNALDAKETA